LSSTLPVVEEPRKGRQPGLGYNVGNMFAFDNNIIRGVFGALSMVLFYGFSFWRIFRSNPKNKVIECGSLTIMVFVVMLALSRVPNFPIDFIAWLGPLVFLLCMLTMVFLVMQGYRALRRRKTD